MATSPKTASPDAASPDAASPDAASPPGKSKKKKKILIIGLLVLVLAGLGGGYFFMTNRSATAPKEVKAEMPIFMPLEPFTVNLQPGGRNRFLHVAVTLKMTNAASQTQMTQYLPEVRSRVLSTLSNREAGSLATPEDKTRLSSEIMQSLSQPFAPNMPQQKISSVMFTTFMLQ